MKVKKHKPKWIFDFTTEPPRTICAKCGKPLANDIEEHTEQPAIISIKWKDEAFGDKIEKKKKKQKS